MSFIFPTKARPEEFISLFKAIAPRATDGRKLLAKAAPSHVLPSAQGHTPSLRETPQSLRETPPLQYIPHLVFKSTTHKDRMSLWIYGRHARRRKKPARRVNTYKVMKFGMWKRTPLTLKYH